jgi:uncharacterized protein DUF4442
LARVPTFSTPGSDHVASARAELEPPDFAQITDGADFVVPVSVTDRNGNEVVHADITTRVTPAG